MRIGSNISSLRSQRLLSEVNTRLQKSLERLSTGQRINRASDDASGLSISAGLQAQSRSLTASVRNINEMQSQIATAESGMRTQIEILQRLQELAVQAANGILSNQDRAALHEEMENALQEFNRIAQQTRFNDKSLLDGSLNAFQVQVGSRKNQSIDIEFKGSNSSSVFTTERGGQFTNAQTLFSTAGYSEKVDHGDLNGDGVQDLVASDYDNNRVVIFLGSANGTYTAVSTMTGINSAEEIKIGDYDGDGISDIAISEYGASRVRILLGSGDGTSYTTRTVSTGGDGARGLAVADFDGDGTDDLFFSLGSSNKRIIFGNENRTYSVTTPTFNDFVGDASQLSWKSADVNGDGIPDLVATSIHVNGSLLISLGDGEGNFQSSLVQVESTNNFTYNIGDIDGDGILDIVTATNSGVKIHKGIGNGEFELLQSLNSTKSLQVKIADVDGNGFNDILIGTSNPDLFFQNPDGSFQSEELSGDYREVIISDLNNDGVQDLTYTGNSSIQVRIGYNTQTQFASELSLKSQREAEHSLQLLAEAKDQLLERQSALGALSSRLASAASVNTLTNENITAARSQILDTDFGQETAALIANQIQQQASVAVLSQANVSLQLALSLFR